MRNDRVLIPVLHVAHDAKCVFAFALISERGNACNLCYVTYSNTKDIRFDVTCLAI